MSQSMDQYIILPTIKAQGCNAHPSPYSYGFPAMTAWLGFMHALQRRLHAEFPACRGLVFNAVAVSCHDIRMHHHKSWGDYNYSLTAEAHPVDVNGQRPVFIPEPKCDLTVSLLLQCRSFPELPSEEIIKCLDRCLPKLKLAGGDIIDFQKPLLMAVTDFERDFPALRKKLMPGFVPVERRELLIEEMTAGKPVLDAVLDYLSVTWSCHEEDVNDSDAASTQETDPLNRSKKVVWQGKRKRSGWLVPLSVGFQAISPLEQRIANQRCPDTPHRFAESILTLGEFVLARRIQTPGEMLWEFHPDPERSLYLCKTQKPITNK